MGFECQASSALLDPVGINLDPVQLPWVPTLTLIYAALRTVGREATRGQGQRNAPAYDTDSEADDTDEDQSSGGGEVVVEIVSPTRHF